MSDVINGKPPTSFWIIAAVALLWNLTGMYFYYVQMTATDELLSTAYGEAQAEFIKSIPVWATAAYGTAVTFGVLGCIFLLLRKSWALPAFIVSLVGIVAQDTYAFVLAGAVDLFGKRSLVLPAIVLVIAVLLIVYSRSAKAKGWLK